MRESYLKPEIAGSPESADLGSQKKYDFRKLENGIFQILDPPIKQTKNIRSAVPDPGSGKVPQTPKL